MVLSKSCITVWTERTAHLVMPSIAPSTVHNRPLVIVLLTALKTTVLLQQLLSLALLLNLRGTVVYPVFLHLVVQVLVKFPELLHTIGHTVTKILEGLRFFVPFTVYFKQGFVIGADNVDAEAITLGTLRVV